MAHNSKEEPKTGPQPDRWYNLTLGPSFKDDTSNNKYCTLRYEFKPASIDKTKAGTLHKNKENRVSVEFQNNQLGKPKVTFEGSSEDYKENDAVLFFDGQTFRLERLHRAVKQLRHLRMPGESASASAAPTATSAAQAGPGIEPPPPRLSPPVGKGVKPLHVPRSTTAFPPLPVEVERIDVADSQISGAKVPSKGISEHPTNLPNVSTSSPSPKNDEAEDHIDIEDIFGSSSPYDDNTAEEKGDGDLDIIVSRQNETDDEIADVDDSGDEVHKGRNAAEALRAQVNAEERDEQTSSSSSSSGSGSSGSGSGSGSSSSSDSEGSDEDSVNSI
ncbi:ELL-associated factor, putative [Ricinus communis]|uniref:ELL-associated factor, putative n=1 Tax=Ricinus communis TaxID=3988 RepID=B9SYJ2_RICCO|nr:ELL-associated factor, putative [Ricinus communis]|eukprot:XP_002531061.1 ELL-associated factor 1 [Ricinus communis]